MAVGLPTTSRLALRHPGTYFRDQRFSGSTSGINRQSGIHLALQAEGEISYRDDL
jgi:hypothetical protein